MKKYSGKKTMIACVMMLGLPLIAGPAAYAATTVNLSHQPITLIQSLITQRAMAQSAVTLDETQRSVDFKKTLHIRVQEKYLGYPVWGGDFIIHVPQGKENTPSLLQAIHSGKDRPATMNGTLYEGLRTDLSHSIPDTAKTQLALQQAIKLAANEYPVSKHAEIKEEKSEVIIYIDNANKARWAFKVSFLLSPTIKGKGVMPANPVYIMDATTFEIYDKWNDVQTLELIPLNEALGGGYGGNLKMGKLVYDGLEKNLPKLNISYSNKTCYWQNAEVTVKSDVTNQIMTFPCANTNADHDGIYWNEDLDAVNGGYGPANDALFAGTVIKDMYMKWYGVPVLTNKNGTPMMLNMVVHYDDDNAYWDGKQMVFGDGINIFYPLTSLGVGAHEVSHGFTQQHSNLTYSGQSGGMNEAFSDMAAQAAEFYAYGKNNWQIGPEIFKAENEALRYMDKPSKDCPAGRQPGQRCSIDHATQYFKGLNVHYSSGVYNRLFYLMGTAKNWDTKKAFDVMVHAQQYWTKNSTFDQGVCGIMKAAVDLSFDTETIKTAADTVGLGTGKC